MGVEAADRLVGDQYPVGCDRLLDGEGDDPHEPQARQVARGHGGLDSFRW